LSLSAITQGISPIETIDKHDSVGGVPIGKYDKEAKTSNIRHFNYGWTVVAVATWVTAICSIITVVGIVMLGE
jgi:hypothetical protein